MVCRDFILPEPANYVFFCAVSNLRKLLYIISLPVAFDEKLWHGTVDHVTVHADERVVFHFKDGKEIVTRL